MLTLTNKLTLDEETIQSSNLTDKFTSDDLVAIGNWVADGYVRDKTSRSKWEVRSAAAMDLAMQIQKAKNFPWPGSANVAFPLVTIAIMQFHARAYPAIVPGPEVVKYSVTGDDSKGTEKARADRIGMHMSWQLREQDKAWESQHDRLLINLATVGTAFKKSFPDSKYGGNKSELVMAKDLVMDYYAKSCESCPRKTHTIPLFRNEIYERVKRGTFRDVLNETWYKSFPATQTTPQQAQSDNRQGVTPPQPDETTPFTFLEQHCDLDLDGDGYAEPYIITVEEKNKFPVRIVCRFERPDQIERTADKEIITIRATEYFTKYTFIPSPDGGIYDVGFGILLGPLNESTNSLINQLIDAGSMANAAGGFLGRGAKIRGGVYTFAPFGWQRVDSTGEDLHKSIFPLPVRDPSMVLFQLLSLLINYTNRISGSTDIMVGESVGQNTAADTARLMAEQGMKIYNALFKRVWQSMKEEFSKLYILNGLYMPDRLTFGSDGQVVTRQDYLGDPSRVNPVADPNTTSDADRVQQATMIKQAAMQTRGYDQDEVEKRWLKALRVDNINTIFPGTKGQPPPEDPKVTLQKMKNQVDQARLEFDKQAFMLEMQSEQKLLQAQIDKLEADAAAIIASIGAEQAAQQLERFNGIVEMLKGRQELVSKRMELMQQQMETANAARENANGGGVGGMAQPPMQQTPQDMGGEVAAAPNGAMG